MKNPLERFKKFVKEYRPILLGTAFLGLSAFFMFYMSLNPSSKKNHVACTGSTAVESSILNKYSLDPEKTANSGVTITENKQDHFGGATKQTSKSDCDQKEDAQLENQEDKLQNNKKNQDNQQDRKDSIVKSLYDGLILPLNPNHNDFYETTLKNHESRSDNTDLESRNKLQCLNGTFKRCKKYVEMNVYPVLYDPSCTELSDPIGLHEPTQLGFGRFKTSVQVPGMPKSFRLKLSHIGMDVLSNVLPPSKEKSLITDLEKCASFDFFHSRSISGPSDQYEYYHKYLQQYQHTLMKEQIRQVLSMNPHVWIPMVLEIIYPHMRFQIPNHVHIGPNTISLATKKLEKMLFPNQDRFLRFCKTENGSMAPNNQVRTEYSGFIFEFNCLKLFCMSLEKEHLYDKYLNQRISLVFKNSKIKTMDTSMLEVKVNVTRVVFDGVRFGTKRLPVVKKLYPLVQKITYSIEEFIPIEWCYQEGSQRGDTVNFDRDLQSRRIMEMTNYNLYLHHELSSNNIQSIILPVSLQSFLPNAHESHYRSFSSGRFMFTYNFSLFDILDKLTAAKNKLRS